jgi:toxin ParE1/3/4
MAYKIIFAPTAIARLEDIVRYIAADDPATAKTFAMHLLDRANLLSEFPELGTPYRKRKNVRRLRCDPYFIYYRVRHENHLIEVMDFWHSARMEPNL